MVYATIILIFAIIGMTMLMDMNPHRLARRERILYFLCIGAVLVVSVGLMLFMRGRFAVFYPLLVHLPLIVIFCVISRRGPIKVFFVLLTMIFLSYPPALADELLMRWLPVRPLIEMLAVILFCALTLFLIQKFVRPDFSYVIKYLSSGETMRFLLVPIGYNILAYLLGSYQYGASDEPLRIVLFVSTMGVYTLLLRIFYRTREVSQIQSEQAAVNLQLNEAKEQLNVLRSSQKQAAVYRHDMRHHLSLIGSFAQIGNLDKIKEYLVTAEMELDAISPRRYCENETANLIFTSFDTKAQKYGVTLTVDADLPGQLSINDTELCSLLSNALENAIAAAGQLEDEYLREVRVRTVINDRKLLISTENAYNGTIEMDGEFPKSNGIAYGHGFGIKSMAAIVEQHGGLYSFETTDNVFVLQLMLPLN